MKKVKKVLSIISNFFIIVGFPIILYYGYSIHNEQIEVKNSHIDFLQEQLSVSDGLQIDKMMTRFKSMQEYYEIEFTRLNSDLSEYTNYTDSLNEYIESAIVLDSGQVSITWDQFDAIYDMLETREEYKEIATRLMGYIRQRDVEMELKDSLIYLQKEMIQSRSEQALSNFELADHLLDGLIMCDPRMSRYKQTFTDMKIQLIESSTD